MVRRRVQPRVTTHPLEDTFLDRQHGAFRQSPFTERIGGWGDWVTLASATPFLATDPTLADDHAALVKLGLGSCFYGGMARLSVVTTLAR